MESYSWVKVEWIVPTSSSTPKTIPTPRTIAPAVSSERSGRAASVRRLSPARVPTLAPAGRRRTSPRLPAQDVDRWGRESAQLVHDASAVAAGDLVDDPPVAEEHDAVG